MYMENLLVRVHLILETFKVHYKGHVDFEGSYLLKEPS